MAKKDCTYCKWYHTDIDLPRPVCKLHEFHFEGDYTPCEEYEGPTEAEIQAKEDKGEIGCIVGLIIIIIIIIVIVLYNL